MRPQRRLPSIIATPLCCCALLMLSTHAITAQPPHPAFDVASVRPAPPGADPNSGSWSPPGIGRFTATHLTLSHLLQLAYGIDDSQVVNKPEWLDTNLYDIVAKPEPGVSLARDELRPRLQSLLEQRFHLVAHIESRPVRGYVLLVAKGGPHLSPTRADHFPGFRTNVSPGEMRGFNWSLPQLARFLTPAAGFPVLDQTGLSGSYDIAFSYASDPSDTSLPQLAEALKQATGLFLKPQKIPVDTLVIDSVDKNPTPN